MDLIWGSSNNVWPAQVQGVLSIDNLRAPDTDDCSCDKINNDNFYYFQSFVNISIIGFKEITRNKSLLFLSQM